MTLPEAERQRLRVDLIPLLTIVIILVVQTGGAFWWAGKVTATLDTISTAIAKHEELPRHPQQAQTNQQLGNRVTRLEFVVEKMNEDIKEQTTVLKDILDELRGAM